jgi:excisionase family DNA binding protein
MKTDEPRLLYTITQTAHKLSYSTRYIDILLRRGELEAIGSRRGRRIIAASVDRFIERKRLLEAA